MFNDAEKLPSKQEKVTIVVQIGNSDDKLTQTEWSRFCNKLRTEAGLSGTIHFAGSPSSCASHQNYCVVVEINKGSVDFFKTIVSNLTFVFNQDSIAWLEGKVEFI